VLNDLKAWTKAWHTENLKDDSDWESKAEPTASYASARRVRGEATKIDTPLMDERKSRHGDNPYTQIPPNFRRNKLSDNGMGTPDIKLTRDSREFEGVQPLTNPPRKFFDRPIIANRLTRGATIQQLKAWFKSKIGADVANNDKGLLQTYEDVSASFMDRVINKREDTNTAFRYGTVQWGMYEGKDRNKIVDGRKVTDEQKDLVAYLNNSAFPVLRKANPSLKLDDIDLNKVWGLRVPVTASKRFGGRKQGFSRRLR
jgi:hypothetical protein